MSKKIDNAQTAYVAAIDARLAIAATKNCAANNAKLQSYRNAFALSSELCAAFINEKISADIFAEQIYAIEKAVCFSALLYNLKIAKSQVMMYVVFRTAINAHVNRTTLRKSDAEAACSAHIAVADDRKHIVYQNAEAKGDSTVRAQHNTSLNALRMMNIIVARKDKRDEYDVNMNALARALCDKLSIDYTQIEEISENVDENV